ncbi:MAG: type II toxin-antitoxin system RelE/ParE family toxin [Sphingomonadaceae bacterium]
MRNYRLVFQKKATKEWNKLGTTLRRQFEKKLAERLRNPHVPKDKLRKYKDCYKIKLRASGYRLIYQVRDDVIMIFVLAIDERAGGKAYAAIDERLHAGDDRG